MNIYLAALLSVLYWIIYPIYLLFYYVAYVIYIILAPISRVVLFILQPLFFFIRLVGNCITAPFYFLARFEVHVMNHPHLRVLTSPQDNLHISWCCLIDRSHYRALAAFLLWLPLLDFQACTTPCTEGTNGQTVQTVPPEQGQARHGTSTLACHSQRVRYPGQG